MTESFFDDSDALQDDTCLWGYYMSVSLGMVKERPSGQRGILQWQEDKLGCLLVHSNSKSVCGCVCKIKCQNGNELLCYYLKETPHYSAIVYGAKGLLPIMNVK